MRSKSILNSTSHIHTHTKEIKMPLIFFLRLWFCFRPYSGNGVCGGWGEQVGWEEITDESLQIMIPVMDLIKIGNSSIFSSFASHRKNAMFIVFSPHFCNTVYQHNKCQKILDWLKCGITISDS